MKYPLLLLFLLIVAARSAQAQSLEELKAKKAELEAQQAEAQKEADSYNAEINDLKRQITLKSGWTKGLSGVVGFNFNKSDNWIANPNPDATSTGLNIGLTAFANREWQKAFWRNKAVITKSWQDVDLSDADANAEDDGLFDNGTVDIFNLNSLAGYKLSDKFALSGMGEMNTSVENFLSPGTIDLGVGATWTPIQDLVVVIHPFNYHIAFSGLEGVDGVGALGAKLRADYTKTFTIAQKDLNWSSTFTTFIPYGDDTVTAMDGDETFEAELFEYTWLNTVSFSIWKGIGVGISVGLRDAEFESRDLQSYYSLGLSYKI